MVYREFNETRLSALGMGAMRLPILGGDYSNIDEKLTGKMIDYALEHGVNYFDTAWGYHDGHSEAALGRALGRHPRDSYYLADKFPGYDLSNMDKVESIFETQLQRCGVQYFDFYLFHNVCELNLDHYLDAKNGILQYLLNQKRDGRINRLGFSAHGSLDVIRRFLDACGDEMEFCQLQLNYVDWTFQDGKSKLELLSSRGLPVWVMEPLRGGKLASLPNSASTRLKALRPEESVPGWAFRFLQTLPEVTVTLSGMSNFEQLQQNIATFETHRPLDAGELDALMDIADSLLRPKLLPCTSCRYCVSHCPQGLDIPDLLALYNEHVFTDGGFIAPMALGAIPAQKQPAACLGCKRCEAVCPQNIKIAEAMADFSKRLGD